MNKPLIHGENIFIPVVAMPKGTTKKYKEYVAGHSETGHHHVVKSRTAFDVLEKGDEVYFNFSVPAEVEHQKTFEVHETKPLDAGIYKRVFATEYSPFDKVIRRIFD